MATFQAGNIVSPTPNVLFDPMAVDRAVMARQNNALVQEQNRQALSANEIEYMARGSQSLLALGDEAQMAAAYPGVVAELQRYGFAKNAPAQFPGVATLQRIAALGTSSEKQAEQRGVTGAVNAYGNTIGLNGNTSGTPGAASTPGATTPASLPIPPRGTAVARGTLPTEWLPHFYEASRETGIPVDLLIAQAQQESSFDANAKGKGGEIGLFQILPSTARAPAGMTGVDPATLTGPENVRNNILFGARYLKGRMGAGDPNDPAVQAAALTAYNGYRPGGPGDPNYVRNVNQYRPGQSPTDPTRQVTTYQPQVAPEQQPGAPRGVAARTGGVDVAGPTGTVPGTPPAPGTPPVVPQQPQRQTTQQQQPQQQPDQQQTAITPQPQQPQQPAQPAAATLPANLQTNAAGLTPQDVAELKVMQGAARTPADLQRFQNEVQQRQVANRAAQQNWQTRQDTLARRAQEDARHAQTRQDTLTHQAQTLQIQQKNLELAEDANRRANEKLEAEAKAAGETFVPGTGIEAVHENTVQKYAAKIAKGEQLTDNEQRLYDGAYYALQQTGGQSGVMTDPNNTGQQIPYQTTRRLPASLPEPKGGALPAVISQPGAAKQDSVTAEQSKAAGYADRVQQALPIITDTSPAAMSRWQQLLGQVPLAGNSLVSPEFQMHMQAERNFINATLRRESGAEIKPTEFDSARLQYIPQPGDSPQVLAQKKQNRETQLAGIIRDAGPSYKPAVKPPDSTSGGDSKPSKVIEYGPDGKRIKQ